MTYTPTESIKLPLASAGAPKPKPACCCEQMAQAKKAMAGFGKVPAKTVATADRLAGPYAFGPFTHMGDEAGYVYRSFVGAGGARW